MEPWQITSVSQKCQTMPRGGIKRLKEFSAKLSCFSLSFRFIGGIGGKVIVQQSEIKTLGNDIHPPPAVSHKSTWHNDLNHALLRKICRSGSCISLDLGKTQSVKPGPKWGIWYLGKLHQFSRGPNNATWWNQAAQRVFRHTFLFFPDFQVHWGIGGKVIVQQSEVKTLGNDIHPPPAVSHKSTWHNDLNHVLLRKICRSGSCISLDLGKTQSVKPGPKWGIWYLGKLHQFLKSAKQCHVAELSGSKSFPLNFLVFPRVSGSLGNWWKSYSSAKWGQNSWKRHTPPTSSVTQIHVAQWPQPCSSAKNMSFSFMYQFRFG